MVGRFLLRKLSRDGFRVPSNRQLRSRKMCRSKFRTKPNASRLPRFLGNDAPSCRTITGRNALAAMTLRLSGSSFRNRNDARSFGTRLHLPRPQERTVNFLVLDGRRAAVT